MTATIRCRIRGCLDAPKDGTYLPGRGAYCVTHARRVQAQRDAILRAVRTLDRADREDFYTHAG